MYVLFLAAKVFFFFNPSIHNFKKTDTKLSDAMSSENISESYPKVPNASISFHLVLQRIFIITVVILKSNLYNFSYHSQLYITIAT